MPVPRPLQLMMNSLKSAELIRELKAETEKLVENNSMVIKPEENSIGLVNLDNSYCFETKENHLTPLRRNVIPYPDHNYGQQPPLTPPEQHSPDPNEQTDTGNEDEDEEGVTRCICGFDHDDGYMICCDRCGSWQHIDCMGIKSDSVPESYLCDRCDPRQLDAERARAIQQKKKDAVSDDDGDDDTDTEEETGQTYTAVSNTPTRITLTATAVIKKKGKNRIKSANSEGQTKNRKKVNRKRQRTSTGQLNESTLRFDSNSVESQIGFENFKEIEENIYDEAVQNLRFQNTENAPEFVLQETKKGYTVSQVSENRKGLIAVEEIEMGQRIAEYKGKILLQSTYEESNPFFKRACPFLLHYNRIDQLGLVVDARTIGNEARYVRRSCDPNSEVIHVVTDGKLHIFISCKRQLSVGSEITIPFDFALDTYSGYVECACNEATCLAAKHNQKILPQGGRKRAKFTSTTNQDSSTRNSASENQGETDSDENELDVGRPISRRKKLSREERKLQAYLKQIEKMEKKEKKVKDPKAGHRHGPGSDSGQSQTATHGRPAISFENMVSQSPAAPTNAAPVPRRIASCTPGSGKKRLSVNKKRPRISSCSSDPLSPEITSCTVTTTPVTPSQEYVIHNHTPDHNGFYKQKGKKDRENLSLSVNVDKSAPVFRDACRKLRRDYLDSTADSPTPPSTPSQLSPASCHSQAGLSVETCSNLASPSGQSLSSFERRHMLNGLLQIADENDENNSCAGSPHSMTVTSNGLVTSEEVMGDIVARVGVQHAPAGRIANRRPSRECSYFGSLKKRWLVQYDRRTPIDMRHMNGVAPMTLSNLMNDFSIEKRAEHIASRVFKTPKSFIPLKKRRLREAMVNAEKETMEKPKKQNSDELVNGGDSLNTYSRLDVLSSDDKSAELPQKVSENIEIGVSNAAEVVKEISEDLKDLTVSNGNSVVHQSSGPNGTTFLFPTQTAVSNAIVQDSKVDLPKTELDQNGPTVKADVRKTELDQKEYNTDVDIANFVDNHEDLNSSLKEDKLEDIHFRVNNIVASVGLQNVANFTQNVTTNAHLTADFDAIDVVLPELRSKIESHDTTALSRDRAATSLLAGIINDKASISSQLNNGIELDTKIRPDEPRIIRDIELPTGLPDPRRTESVHSTYAGHHLHNIIDDAPGTTRPTIYASETNVEKSIARAAEVSLPISLTNEPLIKPLSIVRDPRLSSSSSRSSRESLDSNVFMRSDSVSSVEDSSVQRQDLDRRITNDKLEGTPNTKKKMSLREYRNRKRTKPSTNTTTTTALPVTTLQEAVISKPPIQPTSVLFTDTDSLLKPRTMSISNAFVPPSGKETTFTTSSAHPVSMTTVSSLPESAPSNGPMFEPVSPSEDFEAEGTAIEHNTMPYIQNSSFEVKPNHLTSLAGSFHLHQKPVSIEVSTADAMEIADDDSPLANKIPVGLPNIDPLQNMDLKKSNAYNSSPQHNRQVETSIYHGQQQTRTTTQAGRNSTNITQNYKQTQHIYPQQFRG